MDGEKRKEIESVLDILKHFNNDVAGKSYAQASVADKLIAGKYALEMVPLLSGLLLSSTTDGNMDGFVDFDKLKNLMNEMLALSKPVLSGGASFFNKNSTIVYQGLPGSYSHRAVKKFFYDNPRSIHVDHFIDVFLNIAEGKASYGVLPLENSSTGSISEVYDLMMKFGCYIVGEEIVEVNHCLLSVNNATLDSVKEVYSHEQGLWQCQNYIKRHKGWKVHPYVNTAVSAKHVADGNRNDWAAIASKEAAEVYGLKILEENIQDQTNNYTRFVVVSPLLRRDSDCDKVSVSFVLKHEVGSLLSVLSIFARHSLNILKLESRPISGVPWSYRFFVDIESGLNNSMVELALGELNKVCHEWRLLGNYPAVLKISSSL